MNLHSYAYNLGFSFENDKFESQLLNDKIYPTKAKFCLSKIVLFCATY